MNLKRNGSRAIAALLLFSIVQIGLQVGLAEPNDTSNAIPITPQLVGRLTTRNSQPITVNGLSANTGASIVTGATLETGADQSATVNLGPLGSLDIAPNTKVTLTFDEQANVKAFVTVGCVILRANKGTTGEIATPQGSAAKTDPALGGVLEMCLQPGAAAPIVGPGVAVGAGAGAGAPAGAAAAGAGGLFGLGLPTTIAIISEATAVALSPLFFQENPSGVSP